MKKNVVRALTLFIAAVMLASLFSGCSKPAETKTEPAKVEDIKQTEAASAVDLSKKVELQFYMLGNAPKDLQLINDKINKLAEKDLNCTVKYNYTTWTDVGTKYNLLLSSGQSIDLIFTADWMQYNQYARKGAFLPLDEVLPKVAPELYSFIPEDMWQGVKVGGKIYTIPATWKEYVSEGVAYREDLRKKYNLSEVTSLETLEQYLEGIKQNEPSMLPVAPVIADYGGGTHFSAIKIFDTKYNDAWGISQSLYGLRAAYDKPKEVTAYWGSEDFKDDLLLLKRWADKGFWSKSSLSSKEGSEDYLQDGKTAAAIDLNPNKFNVSVVKVQNTHPDWELAYFPYPSVNKFVHPVHPIHNGFAVPKSSKNIERAVMFYSKMVLDKTYNYLTEYGIQGKHFDIENGYYKMLGDKETNGFQREAMNGWAWRNPEIQLFDQSFDTVLKYFDEFDKYQTPDIFLGFVEDYTSYQAERAALFQVVTQYLAPLEAGFVADVDEGVNTFMTKAKAAGLEKIQEEYKKQWIEYCDEMGY